MNTVSTTRTGSNSLPDCVEYTCVECGDSHHPREREQHPVLLRSICPECGESRCRVTHDFEAKITYDNNPVNIQN